MLLAPTEPVGWVCWAKGRYRVMFSVQSLGSIQETSQRADARGMPRCNFAWSLVGIVNRGRSTGVRILAGGRAAVPCHSVPCRAMPP